MRLFCLLIFIQSFFLFSSDISNIAETKGEGFTILWHSDTEGKILKVRSIIVKKVKQYGLPILTAHLLMKKGGLY